LSELVERPVAAPAPVEVELEVLGVVLLLVLISELPVPDLYVLLPEL